ncbi:MAG: hypothetical protein ACLTDO_10065, partial [Bifidobacterium pseudocatenulatum]
LLTRTVAECSGILATTSVADIIPLLRGNTISQGNLHPRKTAPSKCLRYHNNTIFQKCLLFAHSRPHIHFIEQIAW